MPDPHEAVATFARDSGLSVDQTRELHALFVRLLEESGMSRSASRTLLLDDDGMAPAAEPSGGNRYQDLGLIGVGGMGEVRRVRDRELDRTLAMKIIRADLLRRPAAVARFLDEARVGAQLQHPGVPPIHEIGVRADGRLFFTMKEIKGRPFSGLVREAHAAREAGDVELRRLCDVFATVCDAVAYAHSRGVLHRDLKPDNVMVGAFGEVLVIDWGLAKVIGRADIVEDEPVHALRDATLTRLGQVVGTAAYMPPEQARGEAPSPSADVYALGAMLYEVLAGRAPYEGPDAVAVHAQVLAGPPPPIGPVRAFSVPPELEALCSRAMARDARERIVEAATVAREVREWLDGARRREAALVEVARADAEAPAAEILRERARRLRQEAAARLDGVRPWEGEDAKAPGWALEDEAEALEQSADLAELRREALLQRALAHAPGLAEAHEGLLEVELARHRAASAERDRPGMARAETRLVDHLAQLPAGDPVAVGAAAYLKGDGALTLYTDPEGAEVDLYRYERRNRRLVPVPVRSLGRTPLVGVPLPMGSYLCVIRHPERVTVRYPVAIGRGDHWDGVPPGGSSPHPIALPAPDSLGPEDVYVPAGWFASGGDPLAVSLPARRLWCDAFVIRRFPVRNREYLAFLDDLVAEGREDEALELAPREEAGSGGVAGSLIYGRSPDGRFELVTDAQGDRWDPDWPVVMVHWGCAVAYGRWEAARSGRAWRLPAELEREKAARGVDGRFFPWGDHHDPSWCCTRDSHPARPLLAVVGSFPVDESVYGVRGVGGNVRDWCGDPFVRDGLPVVDQRVPVPEIPDAVDLASEARRVPRGGLWLGIARNSRCACRDGTEPANRSATMGFRLLRPW